MSGSDALFYSCALLNLGGLIYALYTMDRARRVRPDDLSQRLVHFYHVSRRSLLPMTAAALVAVFPLAVTNIWVTGLFLVPFFGFVLVFFPYRRRFA